MRPEASEAVQDTLQIVAGLPVYIAGSAVAAAGYGHSTSFEDVDVFCATHNSLVTTVNRLERAGYERDSRFERVWQRWMKMGFQGWHTNSMKMTHPETGLEVNAIFKLADGHPTTSLSQVVESFDFGLLSIGGYDAERGANAPLQDMRSYIFPDRTHTTDTAYPLMPLRAANWTQGFISQYQGLRQAGRVIKYHDYGYDMSTTIEQIVQGYYIAADYLQDRDKPEKQALGKIFEALADQLSDKDFDKVRKAAKEVDYIDDLDMIMEMLE